MELSLRECLGVNATGPGRHNLGIWLREPLFRPRRSDDAFEAAEHAVPASAVSAPDPGDVYLVGVDGGRGVLFRAGAHTQRSLTLDGSAAVAWAAREAPFAVQPRALTGTRTWGVHQLTAGVPVTVLHGRSYDLALHLAAISLVTATPLLPTVVALGTVQGGMVGVVDGLEAKLQVLVEWALGLEAVLVAADQREEVVHRLAKRGRTDVSVHAVDTVAAALGHAFAGVDWAARAHAAWQTDEERDAASRAVYRQAVSEPQPLLGWTAVEGAAERLAERCQGDAKWRASVAHAIAARHNSRQVPLCVPHERLQQLPRGEQLQLLAHAVQHATDFEDHTLELAVRARGYIPSDPLERHREDLILLGAIARAHAECGQESLATQLCHEAVEGWLMLDQPREASRPLCELVRLLGLSGDAAGLEDALRSHERILASSSGFSEQSKAYFQFEFGRACALTSQAARAIEILERGADWSQAAQHTGLSRQRWLARVLVQQGDASAGAELRARLIERAAAVDHFRAYAHLCVLDAYFDGTGDLGTAWDVAMTDTSACLQQHSCSCADAVAHAGAATQGVWSVGHDGPRVRDGGRQRQTREVSVRLHVGGHVESASPWRGIPLSLALGQAELEGGSTSLGAWRIEGRGMATQVSVARARALGDLAQRVATHFEAWLDAQPYSWWSSSHGRSPLSSRSTLREADF